ncbi:MAG TPA: TIGR02679 domain-containing protein [Actinomycetes bacterium]|jgi:uncharacterized protein (TIGR02679 family)|nr:TIGR02679 domain-containing protein [Actinomycetes bacterium]
MSGELKTARESSPVAEATAGRRGGVDARLLSWARLPGPAKVLAAARRRLEAGLGMGGAPLPVDLNPTERDQVGQLLGLHWALSGRRVGARALSAAIADSGSDLATLLTTIGGPLRDRPAEQAVARAAAEAERQAGRHALLVAGIPEQSVSAWLTRRGLPRAGSGELLRLAQAAAAVWCHLPRDATPVLLPVLASTALDNPHGLDRSSIVATTVLRLARGGGEGSDPPADAEAWRAAWEELGVVCDELSSRVLVHNLLLRGTAAACRLTMAADGEPIWLTWRALTGTFAVPVGTRVFVCENPSVVAAAADRHGRRSSPLICTNGRPSGAARRLLAGLFASGARLFLHADDDPAGQEIVAALQRSFPGAQLWRPRGRPGERPTTSLYEEQKLDDLLADLV